jgi:hypothetical protein
MSSNIIYKCINRTSILLDRTPYCYHICWSKHNIHYYGRRTALGCHPDEFWKSYFTSSSSVDEFRTLFGEPDIIEIRKIFNSIEKCCKWETKVLHRINVTKYQNWLNKSNGDAEFDATNRITVKNEFGEIFAVNRNDPRLLSGELVGNRAGFVNTKDKDGNIIAVLKNDPKYLSGELVHMTSGMVTVKDKYGTTLSVSKDDPRYLSGELVGVTFGKLAVRDNTGNTIIINADDVRLKTGEVTAFSKGSVTVKDKNGLTMRVSINDPRYLSGELVHHTKGLVKGLDKDGKRHLVKHNDPRLVTGELTVTKRARDNWRRSGKFN